MKLITLLKEELITAKVDIQTGKIINAPSRCGDFKCSGQIHLKTLEGAPSFIKNTFFCEDNKNLTSLNGFPKYIGSNVYLTKSNKCWRELWKIGFSKIEGKINIWDNTDLENICNKWKNCSQRDILRFQDEIEDYLDII